METTHRICPSCGNRNHRDATWCACGLDFKNPRPRAARPTSSSLSLVLALVPAVLVVGATGAFVVKQNQQANAVSRGIISNAPRPKHLACVEVYGVNLNSSKYDVPELKPRAQGALQTSSVVSGMIRNGCSQRLKSVSVQITVEDPAGKKTSAWAGVQNLDPGQTKSFERAWTGRIAKWEIVQLK